MNELLQSLKELQIGTKKTQLVRTKEYDFEPEKGVSFKITSYNVKEQAYRSGQLPLMARGLFTRQINGNESICIRGYDKFFNISEVPSTTWAFLKEHTKGPYQVTLKENGCIIYVSAVDGYLLVTSKHALGSTPDRTTHAQKGEEWVLKHVKKQNKSVQELIQFLEFEKVTAVFELADDEFEEHVLAYPKEKAGLYVHGLNDNVPEFCSRSFDQVQQFGATFGFWVVENITLNTIQQVQKFSEECAKTGTYKNVPVEGFVVRTVRTDTNKIHFFKIKFDEPYLMFREWREVTRVLLKNKKVSRYRFRLTEKYVSWCTAQIRQNPHLFKQYQFGKGIIYIRNLFLVQELGVTNFSGIDLQDFCKPSDLDENYGAEKCLIVPVATIGVGKTTLGRALTNLYPDLMGHVQNDNIAEKKAAEVFEQKIMDLFMEKDIVYADRNNHLAQHRDGLSNAFKAEYPGGRIIALDWGIDYADKNTMFEITAKRVEDRGENHQSLTPSKDYKRIIKTFLYHRDPIDLDTSADSRIDLVVDLSIDHMIPNIKLVIDALCLGPKTNQEMEQAYADAKEFKETFKKQVKMTKERMPLYYGVKITSELTDVIKEAILGSNYKDEWNTLGSFVTLGAQKGWHSTITVRSKETKLLKEYDDRWKKYKASQESDGLAINTIVKLKSKKLLWNEHVMTLEIQSSDPEFESMNKYRHVTIATLKPNSKPFWSNMLLEDAAAGNPVHFIPLEISFTGSITGFFY